MVYCGEFEFVPCEGRMAVLPCWADGATEGNDLDDAVKMAADWLRIMVLDALAKGETYDCGGFGHVPKEGGRIIAVAIDTDKHDIPSMSASEAARRLGISTARVAQLCNAGLLESWKDGSCRMVSCESVEIRLEEMSGDASPARAFATSGTHPTH